MPITFLLYPFPVSTQHVHVHLYCALSTYTEHCSFTLSIHTEHCSFTLNKAAGQSSCCPWIPLGGTLFPLSGTCSPKMWNFPQLWETVLVFNCKPATPLMVYNRFGLLHHFNSLKYHSAKPFFFLFYFPLSFFYISRDFSTPFFLCDFFFFFGTKPLLSGLRTDFSRFFQIFSGFFGSPSLAKPLLSRLPLG